MPTFQKIPLLPQTSDQIMSIELGGNPYILRVVWNERFGYFSLSIFEADETPILINVKMVKNYPLTSRYKDTRLPTGVLFFIQEKGKADRAGYDDLATNFNLYYVEPDAAVAAQTVRLEIPEAIVGTIWDSGLTEWDSDDTLWDQ